MHSLPPLHEPTSGRRRPLLQRVPRRFLVLGVLTALATGCGSSSATVTPAEFDAERAFGDLETIVGFGPRPAGSEALDALRAFLAVELEALGLDPVSESFTAETPAGPIAMTNLYADFEGRPRKDGAASNLVILCAHIDTKRMEFEFVGANDGGSGTAALLELARSLTAAGPRAIGYRFLFLDGEEAVRPNWAGDDNTYGSRHHAKELQKSTAYERVKACVLLDMVADKDFALTIENFSDNRLRRTFYDAARRIGLGAHVSSRSLEVKDDHLSFMAVNVPSVDLIDFEYGPNNGYWHTAEDTLDKCSAASLGAIGRIVLAGLPELEERFGGR